MKSLRKGLTAFLTCLAAALLMTAPVCADGNRQLLNGSFEYYEKSDEEGHLSIELSNTYKQLNQKNDNERIWAWKTTASGGLIELFKKNTSTYVTNVTLTPQDGSVAAELNADEESTLYQIVDTEPLSMYEWGLYHGSRSSADTMALIIGPNQEVPPSKPEKNGRDQFMQMVDWLKEEGRQFPDGFRQGIENGGKPIILYSTKFAEGGKFQNEEAPFSLTPNETHTEKWYIWVMTSACNSTGSGDNPWIGYGTKTKDLKEADRIKYRYLVPNDQTKTIFAFVSVMSTYQASADKKNTFGNFLDGISFKLYHPLNGSSTPNGSAAVIESGSADDDDNVSFGHDLSEYVPDGSTYTIQARIAAEDVDTVTFAGVHYTMTDEDGVVHNSFIQVPSDAYEWTVTTDEETGDTLYITQLPAVKSAVSLHFVFVKSPVVTYDANGGEPYVCTGEENDYDFSPSFDDDGKATFREPYTSHAATSLADGWKFVGWQLNDDNGRFGDTLLSAVHTVACNYKLGQNDEIIREQNFIVLDSDATPIYQKDTTSEGVKWLYTGSAFYDRKATGLTMVAQWLWRQTFIPLVKTDDTGYKPTPVDGLITGKATKPEGEAEYVSYSLYADEGETVTATANASPNYRFDGWYRDGNDCVTLSPALAYIENKREVNTYYARFTRLYTQTYLRQIPGGNGWRTLAAPAQTGEPSISTASITDVYGKAAGSAASDGSIDGKRYVFAGWYDGNGRRVEEAYLLDQGTTLSYSITEDATYYARFLPEGEVELAYDANGGTGSMPSRFAEKDAEVMIAGNGFTAPEHCGFVGWNTQPDGTGTSYNEGNRIVLTADKTILYAQWEQIPATLVYEPNGGTGTTPGYTGHAGDVTALAQNAFTYENHSFTGWNAKPGGSGTAYKEGDSFTLPAGETVLYAQWAQIPASLVYDANGGTGTTPGYTGHAGDVTALAQNAFTYENRRFTGWNAKPDGSGTAYKEGDSFTLPAGKTVLYAQWAQILASLVYDANGGTGTTSGYDGYAGDVTALAQNAFAYENRRFTGWNAKPDGSGAAYKEGESFTLPAGETVLYAQWEQIPASLVYDANGGTGKTPGYTGHAGDVTALAQNAFAYENRRFTGWNAKPDGSGTAYKEGESFTLPAGKTVLYAQWEQIPASLVYDANGGTGETPGYTGYAGDRLALANSAFTYENHSFTGWNAKPDGSGTAYKEGESFTLPAGKTVLYAQWTERERVALVYEPNGGSGSMPAQTGYAGERVTVAENGFAAPAHASFTGWNTQPGGTGIPYAPGGDYQLLAHYPNVLYAQWRSDDPASLRYDANGGTGTTPGYTGYAGDVASLADSAFAHENHRFTGWNEKPDGSGTAYAPGERIILPKGETVLYAQWEAAQAPVLMEPDDLPETGDPSRLGLWCLLAAAAAAALPLAGRAGRKR